jgi:hypothetical protein
MGSRIARRSIHVAVLAFGLALAAPAAADEYDSQRAGHPLRVIAYAVHPVGVMFDYLILRPCHWLGTQEPFSTIFGHTEDRW